MAMFCRHFNFFKTATLPNTRCVVFFYRVRYHAARGLIYLGYLDVGGVYLFKRVPGTTEYKATV